MQPEITLTVLEESGEKRDVSVNSKRFTIGRIPDNDLVIENSSLSRRHAVIESFDAAIQISDCGSQNGTTVNDSPVVGAVALRDGDVINLGGVCDITINIRAASPRIRLSGNARLSSSATRAAAVPVATRTATLAAHAHELSANQFQENTETESASAFPVSAPAKLWFSAPVLAVAGAMLILLIAGLLIVISRRGDTESKQSAMNRNVSRRERNVDQDRIENKSASGHSNQNDDAASAVNKNADSVETSSASAAETDEIEGFALSVLSSVSKDNSPVVPQDALIEINKKVKELRGSAQLAEALRSVKRNAPEISAQAKSKSLRPALAAYAGLAQAVAGHTDAARSAQELVPTLARLRVTFGDELANDTLLCVAALEDGPGLRTEIIKLAGRASESAATIRTVWYLRKERKLSDKAYDLVLRFMAVGIIAQKPGKFGVAADAVTFN